MAKKATSKAPASATLLVELLTEELPPRALKRLSESFAEALVSDLRQDSLLTAASAVRVFATPRRLAAQITGVLSKAPDREVEVQGPNVKGGLDAEGKPTPALLGFAKKRGVNVSLLERRQTPKGEVFVCRTMATGTELATSLDLKVGAAFEKLPAPKIMRWGSGDDKFVRPVHSLVMMHGSRVVPGTVFGLHSNRKTAGHRFLSRKAIVFTNAGDYEKTLRQAGKVIPDFAARLREIERQTRRLERKLRVSAISTSGELTDFSGEARLGDIGACHRALRIAREDLLPEVTALVEFPVVYAGRFDRSFLDLPMECLTLSMRQHQRYFPCFDREGRLVSTFLIVSNLETADPSQIIHGNERVLRARLADAKFFYDQDRKTRLEARVQRLGSVVYHAKLGTLLQRVERLRLLAGIIARRLDAEDRHAERAAWLAKADLSTEMVGEFPELQGIMGRYYALNDGEPPEVAEAIEAHYLPRYAGDELPRGSSAVAVALADKLDALAGMFGIGQAPTGDRDPFALRRAALGVVRILVERELALDLREVVGTAFTGFQGKVTAAAAEVESFIYDRLTGYLRDRGYTALEVDSVVSMRPAIISSLLRQLEAVRAFNALPEAQSLAAANKRVVNILRQASTKGESFANADAQQLKEPAEQALFEALKTTSQTATALFDRGDFTGYLKTFAVLKAPVDAFFDSVMVMAEDQDLRRNRLALLADLRTEMNRIADISKLAT